LRLRRYGYDVATVIALWQASGLTRPWNDPAADIALARRGPNSTILIGRADNNIVATAMVGHDGHRGWVYTSPPIRIAEGFGRVKVMRPKLARSRHCCSAISGARMPEAEPHQ
jgi:hypothetical protein